MAKKTSKNKSANPLRQKLPLVLSLLAAALVLFFYFRGYWSDPIANSSSLGQNSEYTAPDELVRELKALNAAKVSPDNPSAVGNYLAFFHRQDLNADGNPDSFLIQNSDSKIHRSLRREGFNWSINALHIYSWNGSQPVPLFTMDQKSIKGGSGADLIDQVEAKYGYALSIDNYLNEDVYGDAVKVFTIVMLDEKGKDASDPLTIYFQPSSKSWKVTNLFEGPDTF